jgi:DMSO reductase family type II enzyme heme b subunit
MRYKSKSLIVLAALVIAANAAGCARKAEEAAAPAGGISARYMSGGLGDPDLDSALWQQASEARVPLLAQDLTDPKLAKPTLAEIRVKALCDDENLAFRIEWEDSTQDAIDSGNEFSDAVAIQLPPSAGGGVPDPTMGQVGQPVNIHLWKASYDRETRLGDWSLRQTYPNATVDHYPFEAAKGDEKEKLTEQYTVAVAAGNPISRKRTSSVDDLAAQGFGSLTFLPVQASKGWSRWNNGRWSVVISRPLSMPGWTGSEALKPGRNSFVAFAVWDGSRTQAGSRKMRTVWAPLTLEGSL